MIEFDTDLGPGPGLIAWSRQFSQPGSYDMCRSNVFYTSLEFKMFDNLLKWVVFY